MGSEPGPCGPSGHGGWDLICEQRKVRKGSESGNDEATFALGDHESAHGWGMTGGQAWKWRDP